LLNLPNLFTLLRLALAPVVVLAILRGRWGVALILFFAAGLSDAFDGFLARKLSAITRFGAYLDPIADKLLLSAIYIALGAAGAIPWWMVVVVFARDLFIVAMAVSGLLFTSIRRFPPSLWGKVSTFLQIAAALVVMGDRYGVPAPVDLALWLMVAGTIWSGMHYGWRGVTLLRAEHKGGA
jgi:cardiolipin synthase